MNIGQQIHRICLVAELKDYWLESARKSLEEDGIPVVVASGEPGDEVLIRSSTIVLVKCDVSAKLADQLKLPSAAHVWARKSDASGPRWTVVCPTNYNFHRSSDFAISYGELGDWHKAEPKRIAVGDIDRLVELGVYIYLEMLAPKGIPNSSTQAQALMMSLNPRCVEKAVNYLWWEDIDSETPHSKVLAVGDKYAGLYKSLTAMQPEFNPQSAQAAYDEAKRELDEFQASGALEAARKACAENGLQQGKQTALLKRYPSEFTVRRQAQSTLDDEVTEKSKAATVASKRTAETAEEYETFVSEKNWFQKLLEAFGAKPQAMEIALKSVAERSREVKARMDGVLVAAHKKLEPEEVNQRMSLARQKLHDDEGLLSSKEDVEALLANQKEQGLLLAEKRAQVQSRESSVEDSVRKAESRLPSKAQAFEKALVVDLVERQQRNVSYVRQQELRQTQGRSQGMSR
jgi:hypothetical protein